MPRTSRPERDRQLRQLSLDDLGTPLSEVTFCVLDLETTGGSVRNGDAITEVGAVRYRGGERLATFQTLVNPGSSIPPFITYLTGITEAMVAPAPPIEAVLPSLHEFIGDAVIVGHNVRFDLSFLRAAATRLDYEVLANRVVDTCSLARRLVRDEVANCKLHTLASRFRLANVPSHRALDDALATADLLHLLIERAAGLGVLGLDDLLELPTIGRHPQAAKLKLTNGLPRSPGVYVFRGSGKEVLYVGKATNLRARVRSYFGRDDRRKIGPLLSQTFRIDHLACATEVEAAVVELRTIQRHLPPFNRVATQWPRYAYIRIDEQRGAVRVTATRQTEGAGWHVGPVASLSMARLAAEGLRQALAELGTRGARCPQSDRLRSGVRAPLGHDAHVCRQRAFRGRRGGSGSRWRGGPRRPTSASHRRDPRHGSGRVDVARSPVDEPKRAPRGTRGPFSRCRSVLRRRWRRANSASVGRRARLLRHVARPAGVEMSNPDGGEAVGAPCGPHSPIRADRAGYQRAPFIRRRQYYFAMSLLMAFVGGFLAVFVLGLIGFGLLVRSARRALRITPGARTAAPVRWLWSPFASAFQHRRLRTAAGVARATGQRYDTDGWVAADFPALVGQLQDEAVAIEQALVHASATSGRARRQLLVPVVERIERYEVSVARLVATADDWSAVTQISTADRLQRVDDKLEAVRQAASAVRRADSPMP